MKSPLLVDTDVMVDYLRGNRTAVAYIQHHAERIILSSMVVAELYAGVRGDAELATLDELVSLFHIIPVTTEIAQAGGLLRRDFAKSHNVGLADAIIAATTQAELAELATLNTKHYPMFPDLDPAYTKN